MKPLLLCVALFLVLPLAPARAQENPQFYTDRFAKTLDVCPDVSLTAFDFKTAYVSDAGFRRSYSYAWRNKGAKPVVAFEIRVLRFNPFDEPLADLVTTIPGHDSGNFSPLAPGESDSDGVREGSDADLFTALAYVDKVRFADGTVWRADAATVDREEKKAMPALLPGAFMHRPKATTGTK